MKKDLFILCENYPYQSGEYFLDEEVFFLSKHFRRIWILTNVTETQNKRATPKNVQCLSYTKPSWFKKKYLRLKALFFIPLWKDFFESKKKFNLPLSLLTFRTLWSSYVEAHQIKNTIERQIFTKNITLEDTIFYAYWHDNKALALAMLKNQHSIKAIARAHGWDIDYKRHSHPYLPFKNYIASSLNYNISISSFGKKMLENVTKTSCYDKIIVSRLGKNNERQPLHEKKEKNKFLICSCSSLISLKRVDLIIDLINKLLIDFNVHWVHFGDGVLKREIEEKARHFQLYFDLKGNVPNSEILDFYTQNFVDLFINMSLFEGVPVSIMEAQSAGIPVLATNVGGNSEIVNNENGFLIPKDFNINKTAELIKYFFKSNDESILEKRKKSYKNWNENYNANKNFEEFTRVLNIL